MPGRCFLLFLLPLLFLSCKRLDGDTLVEGQVIDKFTGQPVPHAWVGVYGTSSKTSWGSYSLVKERQSDGSGRFGFQFETDEKHYQLQAYNKLGYHTLWDDAVRIKTGRNNKNLQIKAQPPAWAKIKVVNVPPLDPVAQVHIRGGITQDENGLQYINLNHISGDTSFIRYAYPGSSLLVWRIRDQTGKETNHSKPVYYTGIDTTELLIEF